MTYTKYIENITFDQVKALTEQANERLESFDKQFLGLSEVLA